MTEQFQPLSGFAEGLFLCIDLSGTEEYDDVKKYR